MNETLFGWMTKSQLPLFAFTALPRKPSRLMHFIDAGPGSPNWARFKCGKCNHEIETHTATNADLRRGIPCPLCNMANEQPKP